MGGDLRKCILDGKCLECSCVKGVVANPDPLTKPAKVFFMAMTKF